MRPEDLDAEVGKICDILWPNATFVRHRSPQPLVPLEGRRAWTFTILPSVRMPRWLSGSGSPHAAADALRPRDDAGHGLQRMFYAAARAMVRTGAQSWRGWHRVSVIQNEADVDTSVLGWLEQVLDVGDLQVTLPLMPRRNHAKPVVRLAEARGGRVWFAKIGWNDLTRRLVRHEARTLQRLAGIDLDRVLVPGVQRHDTFKDLEVLLMEALPPHRGAPRRGPSIPAAAHFAEIATAFGVENRPLSTAPAVREILYDTVGGPLGSRFSAAATRAAENLDVVAPIGAWHGDWVVQNMAWHGDRIALWDWEHFREGVPLGIDLLHYHFQTRLWHRSRPQFADAWRGAMQAAREHLVTLGLDPSLHARVGDVYALLLARRLIQGPDGGSQRNSVLVNSLLEQVVTNSGGQIPTS